MVEVLDRDGVRRWHPLWNGNPRIATPGEVGNFQSIINGPGVRPYIESKTNERWTWKRYDCVPGEIYLAGYERAFAAQHRPQVVIEPNLKLKASPNKQWGKARWDRFAVLAREAGYSLTQLGPAGMRPMRGVTQIVTPDFRMACAVLANAKAYVGVEGAMHHAAAALGIPAVVLFGGYVSPAQTGYAMHRNLFTGGEPCGMRVPCKHCADAMAAITPEMVLQELRGLNV